MNFNIYNSIILAGIVQGLIFGIIVPANPRYRSAGTLVLVAFIVSFSLDNLQYLIEDVGLISEEQLYAGLFVPFELLSGPLLLLYGLYVIQPDRTARHTDKRVLIPFGIGLLVCTVHKVLYAFGYVAPDLFFDVELLLEFVAMAFDLCALIYLTLRINRLGKDRIEASRQLRWFRIALLLLLVLSAIWCCITIADYFYETEYWYALYIGMSAVIYWMGHVGIYQFGGAALPKTIRLQATGNKNAIGFEKQKNDHIAALEDLLIVQKKFLDPKLTLDSVSEELGVSKSHLSRIINAELGMGFPDYLNSLRVKEAQLYLRHPDFTNYTLLAIGLDAGFNSKTTFNAAFKKATSLTPSAFRNMQN